ncbi:MAG: RnfABCDGE type electron transport complex subunit D [Spirochaeta sp.]|nr:RnfABCDGE type electron transport complex subunit D [Spirochaeta sp.]
MFQKQDIMRRVVYSLVPLFLFATFLYGWRVVVTTALVFALGIGTEYIFERSRKKKVSEAVLVTSALYSLSLPPATPLWIAGIGIIFAVAIGKGVYGGFGRNIYNPAITGRLFIYLAFPTVLTTAWMVPAMVDISNAFAVSNVFGTSGQVAVDTITAATPLAVMRSGEMPNLWNLFLGFRGGSMGESSTLLIILAAIYLMYTRTANWKLITSTFASALLFTIIFYFAGWIPGISPATYSGASHLVPIAAYMMSGSILYVAVFMSTDPISGPNNPGSQWVYGFIIGGVSMTVRTFSGFPEGTSFGNMMGNTFASLLDEIFPKKKKKKKAAPKKTTSAEEKPASKEASA